MLTIKTLSESQQLSFHITMSDLDLQEVLQFAVEVAKQAGKMILKASDSRASFAVETKKSGKFPLEKLLTIAVDLLTEADQAVEEMVKKTISSKYPSHKYVTITHH